MNIKKIGLALLIIMAIILGFNINKLNSTIDELNIEKQNNKALLDSVRINKDKIGELEYSKNILVSDKDKLQELNKNLYDELNKIPGKVSELTNYDVTLKSEKEQITKKDIVKKKSDSEYVINWNFDTIYNKNNFRKLSGKTHVLVKNDSTMIYPIKSIITNEENKINITQGIRKKDGMIEVFIKSDHPSFKVDKIESVIIDPKDHVVNEFITIKPKKFGVGPIVGYGITPNGPNYFIGVGVMYNIIKF